MFKVHQVNQRLKSCPLSDVTAAVNSALDTLDLVVPQGEVAITAGKSRHCQHRPNHGGPPVIGSSDGEQSHSSCRRWVLTMGPRPQDNKPWSNRWESRSPSMEMEIRSSMNCVKIAEVSTGDVWMDQHCYEADGVLVLNRIKLHTCFPGDLQSGLVKMMVVGMGKIRSAQTFHSAPTTSMNAMLHEMGQCVLGSGKILAGLGHHGGRVRRNG